MDLWGQDRTHFEGKYHLGLWGGKWLHALDLKINKAPISQHCPQLSESNISKVIRWLKAICCHLVIIKPYSIKDVICL